MARRFDAAADRLLRTASLLDYNAAYTVLFWFYPVAVPGSGVTAMIWGMNDASTSNRDRFSIRGVSGSVQALSSTVTVGGAATVVDGATDLAVNTWYCGALVRTAAASAQMYWGNLTTNLATQGSANTRNTAGRAAASRMEMGAERTANADAYSGRVKNVKIWARALTLEELICEQWILHPSVTNSIHLWTPLWTSNDNDYSGNARNWTATGLTDEDDPPIGYGAPIWTRILPAATGIIVNLAATTATATSSAVTPSVIHGSLTLDLAALPAAVTSSAITPTVITGYPSVSVDVSSLPAVAMASALAPTVVHGSLTAALGAQPATGTAAAVAPSVVLGSVTVAPAVAAGTVTALAPSVILGSVTVSLAALPAVATATASAPTVDAGTGATVDLSGRPATATATATLPSVILSSVSVAPAAANATTSASAPSVTQSSVSVDLAAVPATAVASAVSPTVVSAASLVLPVRSTSAIATSPASLSALLVVARASSVVTAPESHAAVAAAPTSTSGRGGPSSTATLV